MGLSKHAGGEWLWHQSYLMQLHGFTWKDISQQILVASGRVMHLVCSSIYFTTRTVNSLRLQYRRAMIILHILRKSLGL